jgi:hypothetical protein
MIRSHLRLSDGREVPARRTWRAPGCAGAGWRARYQSDGEYTTLSGHILLASLAIVAIFVPFPTIPATFDRTELMRTAIGLPCQAKTIPTLRALAEGLPSARFKSNWVQYFLNWLQHAQPGITGRRLVFAVGDDELVLGFTGSIGGPDHVEARYLAGAARHPLLLATADHSCTIHTA